MYRCSFESSAATLSAICAIADRRKRSLRYCRPEIFFSNTRTGRHSEVTVFLNSATHPFVSWETDAWKVDIVRTRDKALLLLHCVYVYSEDDQTDIFFLRATSQHGELPWGVRLSQQDAEQLNQHPLWTRIN
jgi:hypothetical protein